MMLLLSLLLSALAVQSPEPKAIPKDSVEVSTRGCLKGRVFTAMYIDQDEGTRRGPDVDGRQFRVTGKRDVMDVVKKHNGERVEVVGIVRKSALSDEGLGMKIGGRTRVVIGAQGGDPTRQNQRMASPGVPVMDLVAIRSLGQRCPIQ